MATLQIKINMDNAAFKDAEAEEVKHTLYTIYKLIDTNGVPHASYTICLLDRNGKPCCDISTIEEEK